MRSLSCFWGGTGAPVVQMEGPLSWVGSVHIPSLNYSCPHLCKLAIERYLFKCLPLNVPLFSYDACIFLRYQGFLIQQNCQTSLASYDNGKKPIVLPDQIALICGISTSQTQGNRA